MKNYLPVYNHESLVIATSLRHSILKVYEGFFCFDNLNIFGTYMIKPLDINFLLSHIMIPILFNMAKTLSQSLDYRK